MKELSQEELIEMLDYFYHKYPTNLSWRAKKSYEQIKSLIESAPKEVREAEVEEFVEKWGNMVVYTADEMDGGEIPIGEGNVWAIIKEYEALKRS